MLSGKSFGQTRKDSLFVFVGEKIEVLSVPNPDNEVKILDTIVKGADTFIQASRPMIPFNKYVARYRVIQNVFGYYESDTISFIVYDHYGEPAFARYEDALLFVSNKDGELIHERYQYFEVYKTDDGRWASPGDPYRFDHVKNKTIVAEPITFLEPLVFDLTKYPPQSIDSCFPKPYYRTELMRAYPVLGAYVEDLFLVKKEGVLESRGIFE
jgi:hypothetical protein